jgi:predicted DNA-binding transcriptional regulator AlpA
MQDRKILTEEEFCKLVNISRTKSWRLRKQGKLSFLLIGKRIGFLAKHIDEFLDTCEKRMLDAKPIIQRGK